jgi:hypothetical protein
MARKMSGMDEVKNLYRLFFFVNDRDFVKHRPVVLPVFWDS